MKNKGTKHVVVCGQRAFVTNAAMELFGLENGQTIDVVTMIGILEYSIASLQEEMKSDGEPTQ